MALVNVINMVRFSRGELELFDYSHSVILPIIDPPRNAAQRCALVLIFVV